MKHPRSPKAEPIQAGKVYLFFDGKPYRVGLLNDCRARLDPVFRKRRVIVSRLHGTEVSILATPPSLNVSPRTVLSPITTR